jgi:putative mycofactocin binding protein MftB
VALITLDDFDASRSWQLSSKVSLRDEAFGALAYHHVTRRLVFLKSRELVNLVRRLGEFDSANDAVSALVSPDVPIGVALWELSRHCVIALSADSPRRSV